MTSGYQVYNVDRRLAKGDISAAISSYGRLPGIVVLHPRHIKLAEIEIPEAVKVDFKTFVMSTEVWIADGPATVLHRSLIFNSDHDRELVNAGTHFSCKCCAIARPVDDQSPDQRYCLSCYEFLKYEESLLPPKKRPAWIPKNNIEKTGVKKQYQVSSDVSPILSTLNGENITVDKIRSRTAFSARGRKKQELPENIIKELAALGMGSKAIAARLLNDYGITANYRSIARRLQGVLN